MMGTFLVEYGAQFGLLLSKYIHGKGRYVIGSEIKCEETGICLQPRRVSIKKTIWYTESITIGKEGIH
ncbi:hypothetical protein HMPREF9413_4901 [Paenibacillus sp. HGF7]|nr:hypothetical protein HMPREF9413_4901 [Paenibacillus sp. HGF7]